MYLRRYLKLLIYVIDMTSYNLKIVRKYLGNDKSHAKTQSSSNAIYSFSPANKQEVVLTSRVIMKVWQPLVTGNDALALNACMGMII